MFWAGYKTIERFFKYLMAMMGGSLILVVMAAPPSLMAIVRGMFVPSIPDSQGVYSTALLPTALLGTEACSLSNITYSYFMWQRGWRDLSYAARQRRTCRRGSAPCARWVACCRSPPRVRSGPGGARECRRPGAHLLQPFGNLGENRIRVWDLVSGNHQLCGWRYRILAGDHRPLPDV